MEIKTTNNKYLEICGSIFTFTSKENNKDHGFNIPSLTIKDFTYWRDTKGFVITRNPGESISYKVYALAYSKDDKGNENFVSEDTGIEKTIGYVADMYEVSDNNRVIWKNFTPEERNEVRKNHEAILEKITDAIRNIILTLNEENDLGFTMEEIEAELNKYIKMEYFSLAQRTYEYSVKKAW